MDPAVFESVLRFLVVGSLAWAATHWDAAEGDDVPRKLVILVRVFQTFIVAVAIGNFLIAMFVLWRQ